MANVAVIGAGVAGLSAAIRLADSGHQVHLFEKEPAIGHKVCGEFLSGECAGHLQELQIDIDKLCAEEISQFDLYCADKKIHSQLPFLARGISRKALDQAMADRALALGVDLHFSFRVNDFGQDQLGKYYVAGYDSLVTPATSKVWTMDAIFFASGKYDIKSFQRRTGQENHSIGFKMHLRLPSELRESLNGKIELHLYRGGYAGLSQIEDGLLNYCCIVDQKIYRGLKSWPALLEYQSEKDPRLALLLSQAHWQWKKPLSVGGIPYGYQYQSQSAEHEGIFVLGDQAAVIPSLTGDGMGIAFLTSQLAVEAFNSVGENGENLLAANELYQSQFAEKLQSAMRLGGYLHQIFRRPPLAKLAMSILRPFPKVVDQLINKTRGEYVSQARS